MLREVHVEAARDEIELALERDAVGVELRLQLGEELVTEALDPALHRRLVHVIDARERGQGHALHEIEAQDGATAIVELRERALDRAMKLVGPPSGSRARGPARSARIGAAGSLGA